VRSIAGAGRHLPLIPHRALGEVYLGRFDDTLATFRQADRYDTLPASRWTWLLGTGMAML
jgi:hypothetical protein